MVQERKVVWHKKNLKVMQVPKEGLEFAFLSEDDKQMHQLVLCKDFLQDVVFAYTIERYIDVYDFIIWPRFNFDFSATRIMVTNFKDPNFGMKICNCLDFLGQIESRLGFRPTTLEKCASAPPVYKKAGVWILTGDKGWIHSPVLLSMFTLMVRIGMIHREGDSFTKTLNRIKYGKVRPYNWAPSYKGRRRYNDQDVLRESREGIDAIMEHGTSLFYKYRKWNYPSEVSSYFIHDSCGLTGFSQGLTKHKFPHWHRFNK